MFGTDGRGCRSNGRFRRPGTAKRPTFVSAAATATATPLTHAPTGSPAAPRRPRRLDSTAGRQSQFCFRPADRPAISNHAPAVSPAAPDDSVVTSPTQVPVPVRPGDRSALTPAVAYDGDLVVSRRTLAPVSSGEPTQHPAFVPQQRTGTAVPHSQRRQHSRCEAPLRLTQSIRLCAISLSAHCRALTQFHSARLFHTATAHCKIRLCSLYSTVVSRKISSQAH